MNKLKSKNVLLYCLSFFIPFFIAFLVFYFNYISGFPFSAINTLLTNDLRYEYLPLYSYLSQMGDGFNTLFFSTRSGLGGDIFSALVLAVSPTDFIYGIIPADHLADAVFWSIVIKIGLCGLTFFIFLKNSRKLKVSGAFAIVFSSCYALMSYNFAYSCIPMFSDLVILLPVLAVFVERLADGEKSLAFVLFTAFALIDNYYMTYMVIIALGIFFLFNLFDNKTELKKALIYCVKFACHIVLSVCLSMVVLLPCVFNLLGGKLAPSSDSASGSFIVNSLGSVIRAMFSMNFSSLDLNQAPNIYCGSAIVLTVLIWFISKEKIRTKISALCVLIFYFASFVFTFLYNAWHGFSDPVGCCSRFSFTYCFFVLYFASRLLSLDSLLKSETYKKYQKLICFVFCFFTYAELFFNDSFIISNTQELYPYQNYNDYLFNVYRQEITFSGIEEDEGLFRCSKNYSHTMVDGMMYGYNDLAFYNSNFNSSVLTFLSKIGINTHYALISDLGFTPPSASLLDVKYFVSYSDQSLDFYDLIETYNDYYVFRNNTSFPIAFLSKGNVPADYTEFSDDPFQNITLVYNDLLSSDEKLFQEQDYNLINDESGLVFSFVADKEGHYFFYRTNHADLDLYDPRYISERNHLYFNVNGESAGAYSWNNDRYIADIGYLKAGDEAVVNLETYPFDTGYLYLYCYNPDVMTGVYESTTGFDVTYAGWHGLSLNGYSDGNRDLVVTLPYERGYNISINGIKTDYDSYRDTFLVLHLDEGNNEIKINYKPYGFRIGMLFSLMGIILTIAVFCRKEKKSE